MLTIDWDILIENHYVNACKDNPDYERKYSREEAKKYWMDMINKETTDKDQIKSMLEYFSIPKKDRGWFHFGA